MLASHLSALRSAEWMDTPSEGVTVGLILEPEPGRVNSAVLTVVSRNGFATVIKCNCRKLPVEKPTKHFN
jgi:hypothetical protein